MSNKKDPPKPSEVKPPQRPIHESENKTPLDTREPSIPQEGNKKD